MPDEVLPLTLTLSSDLRLLSVARAFIEAVCQAGRLDAAQRMADLVMKVAGI